MRWLTSVSWPASLVQSWLTRKVGWSAREVRPTCVGANLNCMVAYFLDANEADDRPADGADAARPFTVDAREHGALRARPEARSVDFWKISPNVRPAVLQAIRPDCPAKVDQSSVRLTRHDSKACCGRVMSRLEFPLWVRVGPPDGPTRATGLNRSRNFERSIPMSGLGRRTNPLRGRGAWIEVLDVTRAMVERAAMMRPERESGARLPGLLDAGTGTAGSEEPRLGFEGLRPSIIR